MRIDLATVLLCMSVLIGCQAPSADVDARQPLPPEPVARTAVVDQAQLVYNGGLSARTLPGYSHWQSFTAGITGQLVQIDIGFFNDMCGDGTLAVYSGEGTRGERLYSGPATVTADGVGRLSWNCYLLRVAVTAGRKYTFHFTPNAQTMPDPYGVCIGAGTSLYPRGIFTHVDPSGEYADVHQSVFRTHVIPDSP